MIEYRTDPDAVIALLPDELDRADDPGAVSVIFADWQSCSEGGKELLDPYFAQYKECFIWWESSIEGNSACRCVYIWVD